MFITEKPNQLKFSIAPLEKFLAILGLLFFTGGLGTIFPSSLIKLIRQGMLIVLPLLLILRARKTWQVACRNPWLWAVTAIAAISFLWSDLPGMTLLAVRSQLLQMSLFGLYVASRFSLREQFHLLLWTLGLGSLLSLVYVLAFPSIGIHLTEPHLGAWKGIYNNKNSFGALTALSTAMFFLLAIYEKHNRWRAWSYFSFCVALVLLSTSKTALSLSFIMLIVVIGYRSFRFQGKKTIVYLSIAVILIGGVLVTVISFWNPILNALGRDHTLSGRTLIWEFLTEQSIPQRPWLGYGKDVFFKDAKHLSQLYQFTGFTAPHAHNGYYELILDIGLIGFFCFIVSLLIAYFHAFKLGYKANSAEYLWPFVALTDLILNNYTESLLMRLANIFWVLYIIVALSAPSNQRVPPAQNSGSLDKTVKVEN